MAVERAIRFNLPNQPGELLRVVRQIAEAGVNLRSVAGVVGQDAGTGTVELLVSDPDLALRSLRDGGTQAEEVQVAVAWLPDRPGTLAAALQALADEGINIESIYLVSTDEQRGRQAAFGCSDPQRADQILSNVSY